MKTMKKLVALLLSCMLVLGSAAFLTAGAEGAMKESVNIGIATTWETLTPFRSGNAANITYARMVYDYLAYQTAEGEILPVAAKSWTVEEDGVTWNIELYDYIEDSAGNKITAADVVWMLTEQKNQALRPEFNKLNSAEQTGDYTLRLVLTENVIGALEGVLTATPIVSKKAFEESPDGFANSVVSTSPYLVTDFVSYSSITFEKRDNYWQKAELIDPRMANNIQKVVFKYISESSQMQIALETGEVEAFATFDSSLVPMMQGDDRYIIAYKPMALGAILFFSGDASRPVANDANLRRAIAYAIDEQGILAGVYSGLGQPMHGPDNDTMYGYQKEWANEPYYPYDVEKAKECLAQSSYQGEEISVMASSSTRNERMLTMIQAYLAEVGITMKLNLVDRAFYAASANDGSAYDMIVVNTGGVYLTQFWGQCFDATAFTNGDARGRKDETLTAMIKEVSSNEGFTPENINAIHKYINDEMYAYGMCQPFSTDVYLAKLGIENTVLCQMGVDYTACTYSK